MRSSFRQDRLFAVWIALLLAGATAGCRSYHGYQPDTLSPPDHGAVPDTKRPDTSPPPKYPGTR